MMDKTIVTLGRAIEAHGKELSELELREPTVEDVQRLGYPYTISTEGGVRLEPKVVGGYIARLAGIPPSSVTKLSIADFQRLQVSVLGFFGMGDGETQPN